MLAQDGRMHIPWQARRSVLHSNPERSPRAQAQGEPVTAVTVSMVLYPSTVPYMVSTSIYGNYTRGRDKRTRGLAASCDARGVTHPGPTAWL